MSGEKLLLDLKECSHELRVSASTMLKLVNGEPDKGVPAELACVRIRRRIFVRPETLREFIDRSEARAGVDSAA